MQRRQAYPRKAVIERTIEAARMAGIKVEGFEVSPSGTITIHGAGSRGGSSALDRWKARKE